MNHICEREVFRICESEGVCICRRLETTMFSWMSKEGGGTSSKNGDVLEGVAEGLKGIYK